MTPHTVIAQRATRGCDADLGARVAGQDRARGTGLDMLEHDVGHVSDILSPILIPRVHIMGTGIQECHMTLPVAFIRVKMSSGG